MFNLIYYFYGQSSQIFVIYLDLLLFCCKSLKQSGSNWCISLINLQEIVLLLLQTQTALLFIFVYLSSRTNSSYFVFFTNALSFRDSSCKPYIKLINTKIIQIRNNSYYIDHTQMSEQPTQKEQQPSQIPKQPQTKPIEVKQSASTQAQPVKTEHPQQPKQQKQEQNLDEDIDKLINQFEQGNLNLTNQQKKEGEEQNEDLEVMKKIKDEYEKFMKEMQAEDNQGPENGDIGMGNLGKAFQQLLSGLNDDDKTGQQIGKRFQEMFKNLQTPQKFQQAASNLLNQFMDKSLLEQPLRETKKNYEDFFTKNQNQKKQTSQQHQKQYKIVCELVQVMQKQPSNKKKMIELFENLQKEGTPPEGIAPSFGLL